MVMTIYGSAAMTESKKHLWPRGQSGNPGGRPRGIAQYIRDQSRDGYELVDLMFECARGEMRVKRWLSFDGAPAEYTCEPSHKDRLDALKFLIERGLGRELESAPSTGDVAVLATYTSTQLLAVFDRVRQLPADTPAQIDDSTPDEPGDD